MRKTVYFVMGVSGTGKTTIGKALSQKLNIPFYDGDDYHTKSNIDKMSSGHPLNDTDRKDWLLALNNLARSKPKGAVIACSALKEKYRSILKTAIQSRVKFVFLEASFDTVKTRLTSREHHFMPLHLLQSQFETLETPTTTDAITISVEEDIDTVLTQLFQQLK